MLPVSSNLKEALHFLAMNYMLTYYVMIMFIFPMYSYRTSFIRSLLLTVLIWCNSYFMLTGVGVSCRFSYSIVSYLYVSCSGCGRQRELMFLLSFTCNYVVSAIRKGSSSYLWL